MIDPPPLGFPFLSLYISAWRRWRILAYEVLELLPALPCPAHEMHAGGTRLRDTRPSDTRPLTYTPMSCSSPSAYLRRCVSALLACTPPRGMTPPMCGMHIGKTMVDILHHGVSSA